MSHHNLLQEHHALWEKHTSIYQGYIETQIGLEQISQGSDHILISTAQDKAAKDEDDHSPTP